MRKILKILTLLFGILVLAGFQNPSYSQLSTVGREFFVGFMENNRIVPNRMDQATLIISAVEDANGFIQYETGTHLFSIKAGEQYVYDFPTTGLDVIHRSSGQIENLGVFVFSDGNIAVHAFNFRERSADGTIVLPLSSLGKDYILTAHHEEFAPGTNPGSNVNYESTMLVVAVENDTEVEIITTAPTINTIPPGAPINITLNKGQSYQIKAKGDLTGTRVRVLGSQDGDCKNIAVFGGNKMTSVGRDCEGTTGDHLFQQTYPLFSWGTEYVHIPFRGRTSGEFVKVLAAENDTEVFVNGVSKGKINRGKFLSFNFGPNGLANISGSRPISVTTFAKSQWCNVQNGPDASNGDPTMVTLSPNQQLIKEVTFSAVRVVGIIKHYVNVLTKKGTEDLTILDGQQVGNQFLQVPGNPELMYGRIEIGEGVHTLSNPEGMIAYVYGSGFIESYGYSAGASLANLNFKTEVTYDFEIEGDRVACLDKVGKWNVIPRDPRFQIFEWTFGDGSEMKEGKVVDHEFTEPGVYEVRIMAFTGDRACDQIQEAIFEVEVVEAIGILEGPDTVCPLIDEAIYILENPSNTSSVRWEVTGGEILSEDEYSAKVKWGISNPDAKITAFPVTEEGCEGDPITMDVWITEAIQPGLPEGRAQICFGESDRFTYRVKDILPNRGYEWFVTGGEIISGQGSSEVVVAWGDIGSSGELWYREFSGQNPGCGGVSDKLTIQINPPFLAEVNAITNQICEGSNLGRIEIGASGGSGVYTYSWGHDESLSGPIAAGLGVGVYTVSVVDEGGCSIVFDSLEISTSAPMSLLGDIDVSDAACFDSSDGQVKFELVGGTLPYRVEGKTYVSDKNELTVMGLARGEYVLEVMDAVGCSFFVPAAIGSPEPLSIAFEIEAFACGGLANGTLLSIPSGGVSPYIFSWEFEDRSEVRLTNIASGQYGLLVKDQNGCQAQAIGEMRNGAPVLRMPSGFNPNGGAYKGVSNCQVTFTLWVYNTWGELLYTGSEGWDGMVGDQDAPLGTYSYMIEYVFDLDGKTEMLRQRGAFTLVR